MVVSTRHTLEGKAGSICWGWGSMTLSVQMVAVVMLKSFDRPKIVEAHP